MRCSRATLSHVQMSLGEVAAQGIVLTPEGCLRGAGCRYPSMLIKCCMQQPAQPLSGQNQGEDCRPCTLRLHSCTTALIAWQREPMLAMNSGCSTCMSREKTGVLLVQAAGEQCPAECLSSPAAQQSSTHVAVLVWQGRTLQHMSVNHQV